MNRHGLKTARLAVVLAALSVAATAMPAAAGCYEDGIGCTYDHKIPKSTLRNLSCDSLWTIRNSIYNEHGYCFKTARARSVFDNSDCYVNNASALDFNTYEQTNIDRIASVEDEFGC